MRMLAAIAAAALIAGSVPAAPCRDAKGHFAKCPPSAAVASKGAMPSGVTKDAKGKCHGAGGKFVKCPA